MKRGDAFSEENLKKAWMQCRYYNHLYFQNYNIGYEKEVYDYYVVDIIQDIRKKLINYNYQFSPKEIIYIPKKNGLLRRMSMLNLQDQIILFSIINYIGKNVDKKFYKHSYGNRLKINKGNYSSETFKYYVIQYNKFLDHIIYCIKNGFNWVCETDISAYYDNINHDILLEKINNIYLDRNSQSKYILNNLIPDFLKTPFLENSSNKIRTYGIPQGVALSALLANIYLHDIDLFMNNIKKIKYIRYVDDIRILGKTKEDVEEVLILLQKKLHNLDLELNGEKTCIYKVKNETEIQEFISEQNEKLKHYDNQSIYEESEFIEYLKKKNEGIIENNKKEFLELNRLKERKIKYSKSKLITKYKQENFKYLKEILENSPDKTYAIRYLLKYIHKVKCSEVKNLNNMLINKPYENIKAMALVNKLLWKEDIKDLKKYIPSEGNVVELAILDRINELNKEYFIFIILRNYKNITNCSILFIKGILQMLTEFNGHRNIKLKIIIKLFEAEIYKKSDIALFLCNLIFKQNNIFIDEISKVNKELWKDFKKYLISNNRRFYYSVYKQSKTNLDFKESSITYETDGKRIYDFSSISMLDLRSIRELIEKVNNEVSNNYTYNKNPQYINPKNIYVYREGIKFKVILSQCPEEYYLTKLPEKFLFNSKAALELQRSYMIGLLWYGLYLKRPNEYYTRITPYIQINLLKQLNNNKKQFKEEFINNPFELEYLKSELSIIKGLIKKSPFIRNDIRSEFAKNEHLELKRGKDMTEKVNILHLTDLHFGAEPIEGKITSTSLDRRTNVINKLINTLKNLEAEWKPEIIIISGDIGWKGSKKDYEEAKEWLDKLSRELLLSPENIIICPGNHDINLNDAIGIDKPSSPEKADEGLAFEHINKNISKPFNNYIEFCNSIGITKFDIENQKSYLVGRRELKGINFIVLNSAWFYRKDNVEDMWIGLPHLEKLEANNQFANEDDEKIIISILHHPKDCLHDAEKNSRNGRSNTYDYLATNSHMIISGHVHDEGIKKPDIIANKAYLFIGGASYAGNNYRNNFSIFKVDKKNNEVTRRVFLYDLSERIWKKYDDDKSYNLNK